MSSLGMVTPIIATIKNIIDDKKDKIGNASTSIIQQHPIQYQNSGENIDTEGRNESTEQQHSGSTPSTTSTENFSQELIIQ